MASAATVIIAAAVAVRIVLLVQPIGGDPGIYAYVGARILAGDVPYRDVFEQKPPGILYTYALAFSIFGRSMMTVQILDAIAWALSVAAVALATHTLWRDRAVTLAAVVLTAVFVNPTLQSSFKQVGQSETWIGLCATAALWCAVRAGRGGSAGWAALTGLSCGTACVFKYNAFPYALASAVPLLVPVLGQHRGLPGLDGASSALRRGPVVGGFVAGFLLPLVLMAGYFAGRGALSDWYDSTVLYNLRYAGDSVLAPGFVAQAIRNTYVFATTNVLWLAGTLGLIVIVVRAMRGDARGLPLLAMIAASYTAILLNAKFYPQYFLQILPLWAVAAACWLVHAARALMGPSWPARLAAAAALALVCSPLVRHTAFDRLRDHVTWALEFRRGALDETEYYRRFGGYGNGGDFSMLADRRLSAVLRESTGPDETVYIYGGEPLVLFLADRRSPSRFIWNDPFLAGGFAGRYTHANLVRELDNAQTPIFIVLKNDANLVDPRDSLSHFAEATDLQSYVRDRFVEVGWLEDFLVFARKGRSLPRLGP